MRSPDAFTLRRCQILLASLEARTLPDRPLLGLQPPDGAQRHPRLQPEGSPKGASARLQTSENRSQSLPGSRAGRGLARAFAPHTQGVPKRHEPVDAGLGRRGQLRGGLDRRAHHGRDRPGDAGADGGTLGASEEVDHFPRSRVRSKKRRRDRLIDLAEARPEWAVGFLERAGSAGWRGRPSTGPPQLERAGEPLHLVERSVAKDDPDPKAVSCYGSTCPSSIPRCGCASWMGGP